MAEPLIIPATDTRALATRLGRALAARHWSVATAESCTGGGIASAITDIPGSSGWFGYGLVTYSNDAKVRLLGVSESTLERHGAVSEAVVCAMAEGAARVSGADLSIAVSGIAGPDGGSDDKPVGTVWLGWACGHDEARISGARRYRFAGDRAAVRQQTVMAALEQLLTLATEGETTV
ncbi:nicotinamide-nucleotide amidohydrolase family protein [Marinimicrobium sp. C6131]|uniref:CinA family protein n=1 Tax=Marinimicrobium sp. C6131 TaxID=3022676 RepID=UPI00223CE3D4|nr:nicotinamide-nucleotide amidohydrolase family protein [Marinimicrobium sp. C6131]UZJ45746.1 nicotinamide-nucleotide amidohydrolase family protein [Marinimicrobium sp. C6131]